MRATFKRFTISVELNGDDDSVDVALPFSVFFMRSRGGFHLLAIRFLVWVIYFQRVLTTEP